MLTYILRPILTWVHINPLALLERVSKFSVKWASWQQNLQSLSEKITNIEPDISDQETSGMDTFNDYWDLKRRTLQAFQCQMMLESLKVEKSATLKVVDIGDSSGRHMKYLRELTKNERQVQALSVNLDPRAIKRIEARGGKALLCRAEDLTLNEPVHLFTTFQMVEHLHNPSIFFRRLALRQDQSRLLVTVPYLRNSRVGLHYVRSPNNQNQYAEDVHVFELSPEDWKLLMRFAGWKPVFEKIYYQYPKNIPVVSALLRLFWKRFDYEGFWGVLLEKDTKLSHQYKDWPGENSTDTLGEVYP
jgi:hypothetical protein